MSRRLVASVRRTFQQRPWTGLPEMARTRAPQGYYLGGNTNLPCFNARMRFVSLVLLLDYVKCCSACIHASDWARRGC